jgi:hypothetical protein
MLLKAGSMKKKHTAALDLKALQCLILREILKISR